MMDDSDSRKRSADLCSSFIVRAPAGSGKTTLLVNRFIRALAEVEDPEQVLAITFTRKAAEEMRSRVLSILTETRLSHLDQGDLSEAVSKIKRRDVEKHWDLKANPSRLAVMTIDAFCANIVRRTTLVSNSFTPVKIEENHQDLYVAAARQAISDICLIEHNDYISRLLLSYNSDWSRLEKLLAEVLEHRDLFLLEVGVELNSSNLNKRYSKYVQSKLVACASDLGSQDKANLIQLYNYAESNLYNGKAQLLKSFPGSTRSELSSWNKILDRLIFTKKGELRKRITKSNGFPKQPTQIDAMKERWESVIYNLASDQHLVVKLREVSVLPLKDLAEDELQRVLDIVKLVKLAAAHLNLLFSQCQAVDFTELSLAAISALGKLDDPTDFALKLDYRLQHILVDEFQDTSPSQLELIRLLVAGWTNDQNRSLFLVGDPMQSIYRFRI